MNSSNLTLNPEWVKTLRARISDPLPPEELIAFAIEIAAGSAQNDGGPFGAVLSDQNGKILSIGWNTVVASCDSTNHAEIHCIRRGESALNTYDLENTEYGELALYSSCSPCIQCFGAIYQSGIKKVFAAATTSDAQKAGFDEGPISDELWDLALKRKGITCRLEFGRNEAALKPFEVYKARGGIIYTGNQSIPK
jgi:guanine deaminase